MKLPAFILLIVAFTMLDGFLTLGISTSSGIDIVLSRMLSAAITLPCLVYFFIRLQQAARVGGVLLMIVSVISTCVSVGIFALIVSRNPFVQWPVAFLAASCGGLALAVAGYLRAGKRLDGRL